MVVVRLCLVEELKEQNLEIQIVFFIWWGIETDNLDFWNK